MINEDPNKRNDPNILLDKKIQIVAKKTHNHTELNEVRKRYSIGTKFFHL